MGQPPPRDRTHGVKARKAKPLHSAERSRAGRTPCRGLARGASLVEEEPDRVSQHRENDATTRRWRIGPTVGIKGDALRDSRWIDVGESGGYRHWLNSAPSVIRGLSTLLSQACRSRETSVFAPRV